MAIELTASDLRSLAQALDGLQEIEQNTGVQLVGHDRGALSAPGGDALYFERRAPDGSDELGNYVLSLDG